MESYELLRFENPESLASAAAKFWVDSIRPGGGSQGVALSGGRIARSFFQACTRRIREKGGNTEAVHFFWADERCVPPEHEESNYKLARDNMLRPLSIDTTQIHRIAGEIDPARAARQAGQDLRAWFSGQGQDCPVPKLDFIFLGMGEDGHVASLFPDGPQPGESADLFVPVKASKPPAQRISMNYQIMEAAKEVLVLVSGRGKESALRSSLASDGDTPLCRILRLRSRTRIFTDLGK